MDGLLYHVEMPLVEVLADMEYEGVKVDKEKLNELGSQFKEIIYAIVGLYKKASFQNQTRDHEKMPNNKFKSDYSNSFNVFSIIPIASINCSSLITKGGAKRIICS